MHRQHHCSMHLYPRNSALYVPTPACADECRYIVAATYACHEQRETAVVCVIVSAKGYYRTELQVVRVAAQRSARHRTTE